MHSKKFKSVFYFCRVGIKEHVEENSAIVFEHDCGCQAS